MHRPNVVMLDSYKCSNAPPKLNYIVSVIRQVIQHLFFLECLTAMNLLKKKLHHFDSNLKLNFGGKLSINTTSSDHSSFSFTHNPHSHLSTREDQGNIIIFLFIFLKILLCFYLFWDGEWKERQVSGKLSLIWIHI